MKRAAGTIIGIMLALGIAAVWVWMFKPVRKLPAPAPDDPPQPPAVLIETPPMPPKPPPKLPGDEPQEGPGERHFGWAGEQVAKAELRRLPPAMEWNAVAAERSWASAPGAQVKLWDDAKKALGKFIPTKAQKTGDCTSFACSYAIEYRLAEAIVEGKSVLWRQVYPPWLYGVGRVDVGLGRFQGEPGAVNAWIITAGVKKGILAADEAGLPPYSGRIADDWGDNGPPEKWYPLAAPAKIVKAVRVKSYEDVRDSIALKRPVVLATDWNFADAAPASGGKRWLRKSRSLGGHAVCVVAVDDKSPRRGVAIHQSWGDSFYGPAMPGEPTGIVWMDADRVTLACQEGDSWSIIQVDGWAKPQPAPQPPAVKASGDSSKVATASKSMMKWFGWRGRDVPRHAEDEIK